jgi:hypothetical protein
MNYISKLDDYKERLALNISSVSKILFWSSLNTFPFLIQVFKKL